MLYPSLTLEKALDYVDAGKQEWTDTLTVPCEYATIIADMEEHRSKYIEALWSEDTDAVFRFAKLVGADSRNQAEQLRTTGFNDALQKALDTFRSEHGLTADPVSIHARYGSKTSLFNRMQARTGEAQGNSFKAGAGGVTTTIYRGNDGVVSTVDDTGSGFDVDSLWAKMRTLQQYIDANAHAAIMKASHQAFRTPIAPSAEKIPKPIKPGVRTHFRGNATWDTFLDPVVAAGFEHTDAGFRAIYVLHIDAIKRVQQDLHLTEHLQDRTAGL